MFHMLDQIVEIKSELLEKLKEKGYQIRGISIVTKEKKPKIEINLGIVINDLPSEILVTLYYDKRIDIDVYINPFFVPSITYVLPGTMYSMTIKMKETISETVEEIDNTIKRIINEIRKKNDNRIRILKILQEIHKIIDNGYFRGKGWEMEIHAYEDEDSKHIIITCSFRVKFEPIREEIEKYIKKLIRFNPRKLRFKREKH